MASGAAAFTNAEGVSWRGRWGRGEIGRKIIKLRPGFEVLGDQAGRPLGLMRCHERGTVGRGGYRDGVGWQLHSPQVVLGIAPDPVAVSTEAIFVSVAVELERWRVVSAKRTVVVDLEVGDGRVATYGGEQSGPVGRGVVDQQKVRRKGAGEGTGTNKGGECKRIAGAELTRVWIDTELALSDGFGILPELSPFTRGPIACRIAERSRATTLPPL